MHRMHCNMQDMEFVYTSSVKCAFFVVFLRNLLQKQATNNHCETYTFFKFFSENKYVTRSEFSALERKVTCLKKRMKELMERMQLERKVKVTLEDCEETATVQNDQSELFNGYTKAQLQDTINHIDDLFSCVHVILLKFFLCRIHQIA